MNKVIRIPLTRAILLNSINNDEVVAGYRSGLDNEPEPDDTHSFSFWHGWRNGQVGGGFADTDEHQRALAHDVTVQRRIADMRHVNPKTRL